MSPLLDALMLQCETYKPLMNNRWETKSVGDSNERIINQNVTM